MSFSIGVIAGLIVMILWGIADFLQALNIKKIGSIKNMFFSNIIGILPVLIAFFYFLSAGRIVIDTFSLLLMGIAGIMEVIAVYNFMISFEVGEISIVTPISASYSLVTVVLAFFFLQESLSLLKVLSILAIIAGIILVSADFRKLKHLTVAKGIKESVIALLLWGIYFFILGFVSKRLLLSNSAVIADIGQAKLLGAITLFFCTTLINSALMILLALSKEKFTDLKPLKIKNVLKIMIINFFLYNLAWLFMNYGVAEDMVSIIAPVSSLYPAITVILASIFLKEKHVLNQKIGIGVTLVGILLISL